MVETRDVQEPVGPVLSATFQLESMASVHVAVAAMRSHPILADHGLEERMLISTVISELGTNIIKFARRGTLVVSRLAEPGRSGIQVVASDRGPGIPNVEQAFVEGFSTAGTLGLGLSAVRRIMSSVDVQTRPLCGTVVTATRWQDGPAHARSGHPVGAAGTRPARFDLAAVNRPMPGQRVSGDAAVIVELQDQILAGIIDVAGHGSDAHELAQQLQSLMKPDTHGKFDLGTLFGDLHRHCLGTRGAAAGLAVIDRRSRHLLFAGIGNPHVRVVGRRSWRGVCRDGLLGERWRTLLPQTVALAQDDIVVLGSDGCSEGATSTVLAPGTPMSAKRLAAQFIADTAKVTDDASCVVIKCL